ncbi:hypothetical protein [Lentibacillus daqui]|uniref:hypothetical protein n=1 Tax=Lentibacillus daqui TaxID=2911514 RepID=UPI0022B1EDC2|nr:hypothetical protein [Lentibacillus daqui]
MPKRDTETVPSSHQKMGIADRTHETADRSEIIADRTRKTADTSAKVADRTNKTADKKRYTASAALHYSRQQGQEIYFPVLV